MPFRSIESEEEEVKPKKPKIIEYVEPEKNYLQENIQKLRQNKKNKKKIGGMMIDEDNFKAMLKQFNSNVPSKPASKSTRNMTQIKHMEKSNTDFSKNEPKR